MELNWTRPSIKPTFTLSFFTKLLRWVWFISIPRKSKSKLEYVTKNDMTAVVLKKRVSVVVETDIPTLIFIGYKQLKRFVYYLSC